MKAPIAIPNDLAVFSFKAWRSAFALTFGATIVFAFRKVIQRKKKGNKTLVGALGENRGQSAVYFGKVLRNKTGCRTIAVAPVGKETKAWYPRLQDACSWRAYGPSLIPYMIFLNSAAYYGVSEWAHDDPVKRPRSV
jgi:hypothetical protein